MSYSPEIFTKKLSVLQDTQESIVSISQWVLFHHRHIKESANIWYEYILKLNNNNDERISKLISKKMLSLLYLCNDVVQQARRKKKSEFNTEFGKILPFLLNNIYAKLDPMIVPKVDRLIAVWEERSVFTFEEIKDIKKAVKLSKLDINLTQKSDENKTESFFHINKSTHELISPNLKNINDLYLQLSKLIEIKKSNFENFKTQDEIYLSKKENEQETMDNSKTTLYISKLNVIEKIGKICLKNIDEIKPLRIKILHELENLKNTINEDIKEDLLTMNKIVEKLAFLVSKRNDLRFLSSSQSNMTSEDLEINLDLKLENDLSNSENKENISSNSTEPQEPLDEMDFLQDDYLLPSYEADNNNIDTNKDEDFNKYKNDDKDFLNKKKRKTDANLIGSDKKLLQKKVSFSNNVEIKEFDLEISDDYLDYKKSNDIDNYEAFDQNTNNIKKIDSEKSEELKHELDLISLRNEDTESYFDDNKSDVDLDFKKNNSNQETSSSIDIMSLLSKLV